jgi:hypothetical protein
MVAVDDRLGNYTSGMVISLQIAGFAWRAWRRCPKSKNLLSSTRMLQGKESSVGVCFSKSGRFGNFMS